MAQLVGRLPPKPDIRSLSPFIGKIYLISIALIAKTKIKKNGPAWARLFSNKYSNYFIIKIRRQFKTKIEKYVIAVRIRIIKQNNAIAWFLPFLENDCGLFYNGSTIVNYESRVIISKKILQNKFIVILYYRRPVLFVKCIQLHAVEHALGMSISRYVYRLYLGMSITISRYVYNYI